MACNSPTACRSGSCVIIITFSVTCSQSSFNVANMFKQNTTLLKSGILKPFLANFYGTFVIVLYSLQLNLLNFCVRALKKYYHLCDICIKIIFVRWSSWIFSFLIHNFEICCLLRYKKQSFTKVQKVVLENKTFYSAHCASFAEVLCGLSYHWCYRVAGMSKILVGTSQYVAELLTSIMIDLNVKNIVGNNQHFFWFTSETFSLTSYSR